MIEGIAIRAGGDFGVGPTFRSVADHLHTVTLSLVIATLAAFVALELAGRARAAVDRVGAGGWLVAGCVTLGSGIWSMHFVGMSAVSWPFDARFATETTMVSWGVAIAAAALPMAAAGRRRLSPAACVGFGLATALGVGAMHFIGLSAMRTSPPPVYALSWLAAALIVAILGCTQALRLAVGTRGDASRGRRHAVGALLVGGSLTALHFLAMASAGYAADAVCVTREGLEANVLGGPVGAVTLAFLALMLLVASLEKRSSRLAAQLGASLNQARDELHYVTFNDAATGLPNRLLFQDRLRQALERGEGGGRSHAVMLVEIDDLARRGRGRDANEVERALRAIAGRLVAAAGEASVASAGSGQFLILTEGFPAGDPQTAVDIAGRIAEALRRPLDPGDTTTRLTASIGIAVSPSDGDAQSIVGSAGVALQAARGAGGGRFAFFESKMDSDARATAELLDDLRAAIALGQLALHYQPKVHAGTLQIAGVEALLRWEHPKRGFVSPAVFVPLAERFGLINEIGRWVLVEAARQMAAWSEAGVRLRVAVNVSAVQLHQPDFDRQVLDALSRHGVEPALLTCEITESEAMRDTRETVAIFRRLEAVGVALSIDDFGTGYSSLAQLRRMPVRQLKVDRSFVSDLETSPDACTVVKAIVELAHALRLEVVAEGVETEGQRDILRGIGCDKFQGFLFARPMPAAAVTQRLADDAERLRAAFRESVFVV